MVRWGGLIHGYVSCHGSEKVIGAFGRYDDENSVPRLFYVRESYAVKMFKLQRVPTRYAKGIPITILKENFYLS